MKANEAPEKIYISNFDIDALPKCEQLSERWHEVSTEDSDIEYTRTDAFIEKACEFLSNEANIPLWEGYDNTFGCDITKLIDNFKKYMKGE